MAAGNPGLEQLAAALDDFRYRVLASDVSYDEQGKLLLGLRLEGSNPTFQQGRQVNLNIQDRKSTRLNSSHVKISYAVFCLKKKNTATDAKTQRVRDHR